MKDRHCDAELIDYKNSGLNSAQRGRRPALIEAPAITDARDHAAALMHRKLSLGLSMLQRSGLRIKQEQGGSLLCPLPIESAFKILGACFHRCDGTAVNRFFQGVKLNAQQ